MKNILLTKEHDIAAFCSTDPTRYVITGIHYNQKAKRLEATTGTILVNVPVIEKEREDLSPLGNSEAEPLEAIIPLPAFKKALGNIPKSNLPDLEAMRMDSNGKVTFTTCDLDTTQNVSTKPIDGQYPNVQNVIPAKDESYTLSIGLNANLLALIAAYAQKHVKEGGNGEQIVKFHFKDNLSPVLFEMVTEKNNLKVEGVLMPCRMA